MTRCVTYFKIVFSADVDLKMQFLSSSVIAESFLVTTLSTYEVSGVVLLHFFRFCAKRDLKAFYRAFIYFYKWVAKKNHLNSTKLSIRFINLRLPSESARK